MSGIIPPERPSRGARAGARTLLLVSLTRFYSNPAVMARALPYLAGTSPISLRLIDWFVTNYAKTHNVVLMRPRDAAKAGCFSDEGEYVHGGDTGSHFNIYLSYRSQLKAYSKLQFDPFRRRERMHFFYQPDRSVETTIGQLNFFRWMIVNNILDYVTEHTEAIENDMLQSDAASSKGAQAADRPREEESEASEASDRPPHEEPEAAHTHERRIRAPTAVCRVAMNMTRVGGTHTVAFD